MESLRGSLPESLVGAMFRKLGREEALRLLWPALVGEKLAAQTRLARVRADVLVVAVPDVQWARALEPLAAMLLEAVNRSARSRQAAAVEWVCDAGLVPRHQQSRKPAASSDRTIGPAAGAAQFSWQEAFRISEEKYFARGSLLTKGGAGR